MSSDRKESAAPTPLSKPFLVDRATLNPTNPAKTNPAKTNPAVHKKHLLDFLVRQRKQEVQSGQPRVLFQPWPTDLVLRGLVHQPQLLADYVRSEQATVSMMKERKEYIELQEEKTDAMLEQLSFLEDEIQLRKSIMNELPWAEMLDKIFDKIMEQLFADLHYQQHKTKQGLRSEELGSQATPVTALAEYLLDYCGLDGKLRLRVEDIRAMEREYFPWRFKDMSSNEDLLRTRRTDSPVQWETDEYPRLPLRNKAPQGATSNIPSSGSRTYARNSRPWTRTSYGRIRPLMQALWNAPQDSLNPIVMMATPSSQKQNVSNDGSSEPVQPSATQPSTSQGNQTDNLTQNRTSDPSTPPLTSSDFTPANPQTPANTRESEDPPPDSQPTLDLLSDRLSDELRTSQDGVVPQVRFAEPQQLPDNESSAAPAERVNDWLDSNDADVPEQGSVAEEEKMPDAEGSQSQTAGSATVDAGDQTKGRETKDKDNEDSDGGGRNVNAANPKK